MPKVQGTITKFNQTKCWGAAALENGDYVRFHSTTFHGRPVNKWPTVGITVDVILNDDGGLVSVRETGKGEAELTPTRAEAIKPGRMIAYLESHGWGFTQGSHFMFIHMIKGDDVISIPMRAFVDYGWHMAMAIHRAAESLNVSPWDVFDDVY